MAKKLKIIAALLEKQKTPVPMSILYMPRMRKIEYLLEQRNPYGLMVFYKNFTKHFSKSTYKFMNETVASKRSVKNEDQELIKNITAEVRKSTLTPFYTIDYIGNFFQISDLVTEIQKNENKLSKTIAMTLFFWGYLTVFEMLVSQMAELFVYIAQAKKDNAYLKHYEKVKEKGEHLPIERLHQFAKKHRLCEKDAKNFLTMRDYRNKIAHANIFYDKRANKIVIKGTTKTLSPKEFREDFERIYDFLKELIVQLNRGELDMYKVFEDQGKQVSRAFRKIIRSPNQRKAFQSIDFSQI